ncbi:MAG TPA: FAD-dependent oxidoreductase [Acetobacteraceae bacterium]|jgi:NADH dehydrogenase|nr:FAD-dependent oxidoreductase [Acetobacteraceae bacterium]
MQRIIVLGAGFAGLWAAAAAARALDARGIAPSEVGVTMVNATPWHSIRVRNYEADLSDTRVALADVLEPIGVETRVADVTDIRVADRAVVCAVQGRTETLGYDRLVFALGSRLVWPGIPGLRDYAFDVDTYDSAMRLGAHLTGLRAKPQGAARDTVLVIGAGLTGIEAAAEMPARLRAATGGTPRVILADRAAIGSDMGNDAIGIIVPALASLGIECRPDTRVTSIGASGAVLATGEHIEAETIVWCAGMEASPLTACFPVARDRAGRVPVRPTLQIDGLAAEFAAGDAACFAIDGTHECVMSCQHGRPMGRFAGHNAVCDLLGDPMLPLRIDWYTTILDLGPWGAVYTEGRSRRVVAQRAAAKRTKEIINRQRIYPPRSRDRAEILAAAAPVVQAPPTYVG